MHVGTVFFLLVYMPFYILSLPMALAKFSIIMLVRMGEHLPCFIPDLREKHTDFYPLVWCQLQAFYRCSLSNYRSLLYFMLFWHFFFIMNEYRIFENAFSPPIDTIMWFFSFSLLVTVDYTNFWILNHVNVIHIQRNK